MGGDSSYTMVVLSHYYRCEKGLKGSDKLPNDFHVHLKTMIENWKPIDIDLIGT